MRPDRIIVGEVRGAEALDMLQAFNTGHDGSISTGHANSAKDMLTRLETMVLMGLDIPVSALRGQIASALEIIVHLGRLRDHSRRVLEIVEVLGMEQGEIVCVPLFEFVERGSDGNVGSGNSGEVAGEVGSVDSGEVAGGVGSVDSGEVAGNMGSGNRSVVSDRREIMQGKTFLEGKGRRQPDGEGRHVRVQGQLIFRHRLKQVAKLMEAGYYDKFCELLSRMQWQEVYEEVDSL
jgi:hypothetical protein